MVVKLDDPQPVFNFPPLTEIPDEDEDRPNAQYVVKTSFGPLSLPALVFGAATFSSFYNSDAHLNGVVPVRTTRLALRYGINAFDTSPYYGPSEIVLGACLKLLEPEFPRSSYTLITKCGRYGGDLRSFDYSPKTVRASVQRSLSRLNTDYLDGVYVHDVEFVAYPVYPMKGRNHVSALSDEKEVYGLHESQDGKIWGEGDQKVLDAIGELRKLQDEGLVKNIGISGYLLPTLLRLSLMILHNPPYKPLDIILSYSHLNLQNTTLEPFVSAFRDRARIKQVNTASPLSMGLLCPSPPPWHPANQEILDAVAEANAKSSSWPGGLPSVALGFAFSRAKEYDLPYVVGLSNLKDVHENVRVWYEVENDVDKEKRKEEEEKVKDVFVKQGLFDWSWPGGL